MVRRDRDEQGATAVIVAMMALVLLGSAAFAIDLGRAVVSKHSLQHVADFAALTAGADDALPAQGGPGCGAWIQPSSEVASRAAEYLTENLPGATSAGQLMNCDLADGEVIHGWIESDGTIHPHRNMLTVVSPGQDIDFGLGRMMGSDGVTVSAHATVEVRSPVMRTMPVYAYDGCDWGQQTLINPSNGHATDVVLALAGHTNGKIPFDIVTNPASSPAQVPVGSTDTIVLRRQGNQGDAFDEEPLVTHVGFFEAGGHAPVVVTPASVTANEVAIVLPLSVTGVQTTWYVRVGVEVDGTITWSQVIVGSGNNARLAAIPLSIGEPVLTCDEGSSEGNFGSLVLEHPQGPNGQDANIAYNMAAGLSNPLAIHPIPPGSATCHDNPPGTVMWRNDGTNCVQARVGLTLSVAEDGLIDGVGGQPGRLRDTSSGVMCSTGNTVTRQGKTLNNDPLSCWFKESGVNVADVRSPSYSGGVVLDGGIFESPRFSFVPLLAVRPGPGTSQRYKIVGFRPAYITDEPGSATKGYSDNSRLLGIGFTNNNKVERMVVTFIHPDALPPVPVTETTVYTDPTGLAPKVLLMVD
ncbi:TadE/TadG family type IV pilus assembly protein [Nocardioides limicola]|uniref:TadE/TadG family type IV pilus assembly protein n=1 Tax=Nocardioides limicola TaxID=2803368 RepID=UPI00193BAADB|nr:Tad domain-containing protein [Nocardioides sp. DJM-14]